MQAASRLPSSIRWYLILAVIGLVAGSLGNLFLQIPGYPVPRAAVPVSVVLNALLMIGIVRFHSNAARWIFAGSIALSIAATVFSLIFFPAFFRLFGLANIVASVLTMSVNVAAVACLFTREAGSWIVASRAKSKPKRAPNKAVLIVSGTALLLLAAVGVQEAMLNSRNYHVPLFALAGGSIINGILGIALFFVAVRRSHFAGVTAIIVAAIVAFGVVFGVVVPLALGLPPDVTWWTAIDLAIVAAILWSTMLPWDRTANKPLLFWMAGTLGTLTFLMGFVVLFARR